MAPRRQRILSASGENPAVARGSGWSLVDKLISWLVGISTISERSSSKAAIHSCGTLSSSLVAAALILVSDRTLRRSSAPLCHRFNNSETWRPSESLRWDLSSLHICHRRREEFMESLGNSLPPLFFESVPSLIEKPPYFSAAVTEVTLLLSLDFAFYTLCLCLSLSVVEAISSRDYLR
jgi:hypothetical protein